VGLHPCSRSLQPDPDTEIDRCNMIQNLERQRCATIQKLSIDRRP
jgi:hypothetical protein